MYSLYCRGETSAEAEYADRRMLQHLGLTEIQNLGLLRMKNHLFRIGGKASKALIPCEMLNEMNLDRLGVILVRGELPLVNLQEE